MDLFIDVAAAAHGLALFLQQHLLPAGRDTAGAAQARAAAVARALALFLNPALAAPMGRAGRTAGCP
ncbi:hypothetical protein [Dactylosporangium sp. CA-092794]|uniref:hypothetical protein n=1 Tax=Dactylosporangium sp. CA-092794 TaxID=3239929 RepID=UPI003D90F4FA